MGRGPSRLLAGFQECYDDLLRFLTRRLGDSTQAVDVVQDTYIRLATLPDGDADIRDPRAFVFRVARNMAIDAARHHRWRGGFERDEAEGMAVAAAEPSPETRAMDRQSLDALDAALADLPAKARQALLLSRVDGLTHAQVAARLGVSESMVAKYLAQALKHCRLRLQALGARDFTL